MTRISGIIVNGCLLRLSKNQLDWFSAYKNRDCTRKEMFSKCNCRAPSGFQKGITLKKWCVNKQMQKYLMTECH